MNRLLKLHYTFKKYILLIISYLFFFAPTAMAVEDPIKRLNSVGVQQGPYQAAPADMPLKALGIVIQVALSLLGIIFMGLIIYAGYNWMTAMGDEQKVTKAKDTITRAVIGLVIVIAAYAVSYFVIQKFGAPITQ